MLTQLTTLKARLGIGEDDVADDALLTNLLKLVSARFERECNRIFGRSDSVTEEFAGDETELRVSYYPIDAKGESSGGVTKFELKTDEATGWETESGVEYLIRRDCVVSLPAPLGTWREQLRITYSGGYVLPGDTAAAGETVLPDDIEQAAVEQAAYLYQNKDRLGLTSISAEGGSIQQFAQLDLLPPVKAVLIKYARWNA